MQQSADELTDTLLKDTFRIVEGWMKDYRGELAEDFQEFLTKDRQSIVALVVEISAHFWNSPQHRGTIPRHSPENSLAGKVWSELSNSLESSCIALKKLEEEVKAASGSIVFIVGAGVSFDSRLNWTTIQQCLRKCYPNENIDEYFQPDHKPRIELWERLTEDGKTPLLKRYLAYAVEKKPVNNAHTKVREFLEQGEAVHALCFNWDNLIERESEFLLTHTIYGKGSPTLEEPFLWKPNGCVKKRGLRLRLPHQGVYLSSHLRNKMGKAGALLTIAMGYSGDTNFGKEQIRELVCGGHIYDVRPVVMPERQMGDYLVSLGAGYVLDRVSKYLSQGQQVE